MDLRAELVKRKWIRGGSGVVLRFPVQRSNDLPTLRLKAMNQEG